jgi:hypothetical protein
MKRNTPSASFKLAINKLKEQGVMDNDTYIALCKELKALDHGIAVRDTKQIAKAVEKLSKTLWETTR